MLRLPPAGVNRVARPAEDFVMHGRLPRRALTASAQQQALTSKRPPRSLETIDCLVAMGGDEPLPAWLTGACGHPATRTRYAEGVGPPFRTEALADAFTDTVEGATREGTP